MKTNQSALKTEEWAAVPENEIRRAGAKLQGMNEKLQRDAGNIKKLLHMLTDTWDGYNAARLALKQAKQKGQEFVMPPGLVGDAKAKEELRQAEEAAELNGTKKLARLGEIAAAVEELNEQLEAVRRRVLSEQNEIAAEQAAAKQAKR